MTWIMVLLWGNVMFGASTVAVYASKDFCDTALAGATADLKAQGLAVFSGMIASTCLAVLFVPSFFTVLQRFDERGKKPKPVPHAAAPSTP